MSSTLTLLVFEDNLAKKPRQKLVLDAPVEVGRQTVEEKDKKQEPYTIIAATSTSRTRLIIAANAETHNFSREHLSLEPLPSGLVRVKNKSKSPLDCVSGQSIPAGASADLEPPFSLSLPPRRLDVGKGDSSDEAEVHSLDQETRSPGPRIDDSRPFRGLIAAAPPGMTELIGWLQKTMSALESTVGASDFQSQASQALVEIVGLDSGRFLRREGDDWTEDTVFPVQPGQKHAWQPSQHICDALLRDRKAVWQWPQRTKQPDAASLIGMELVVAAPVRDASGEVIGALYGERSWRADRPESSNNGLIEALLVDLLATGVATGLARQEKEKEALKKTTLFEQFFTPTLAAELTRQPDLLLGRKELITVLFCDVRGFSRISERLAHSQTADDTEKTLAWMNDVMDVLSVCIQAEEGVLVDYIGDELFAMWGAPCKQDDQAVRAARASLAMLASLRQIDEKWQGIVGEPTRVGIGLNTGEARVGNTGSTLKFKYGPLGNVVNVGSRVQGLTKYLHCWLLVTQHTHARLGNAFATRRVVKTRFVNINNPVDLYEVDLLTEEKRQFFQSSQEALDMLEQGSFAEAASHAGSLLRKHAGDGPLRLTLSRACNALLDDGATFDPIWSPPGK